jgi:hypothetical protein
MMISEPEQEVSSLNGSNLPSARETKASSRIERRRCENGIPFLQA